MEFFVTTITVNHKKDEGDKNNNCKNQLAGSEHKFVVLQGKFTTLK
jgi:hypothetical protein